MLAFPLAYKLSGWLFGVILTLIYGMIMTTTLIIISRWGLPADETPTSPLPQHSASFRAGGSNSIQYVGVVTCEHASMTAMACCLPQKGRPAVRCAVVPGPARQHVRQERQGLPNVHR